MKNGRQSLCERFASAEINFSITSRLQDAGACNGARRGNGAADGCRQILDISDVLFERSRFRLLIRVYAQLRRLQAELDRANVKLKSVEALSAVGIGAVFI